MPAGHITRHNIDNYTLCAPVVEDLPCVIDNVGSHASNYEGGISFLIR